MKKTIKFDENALKIQTEIDANVDSLKDIDGDADADDYDARLGRLERLVKLKEKLENKPKFSTSDKVAFAQIIAQTTQIIMMLSYERTHVFTTKAMQLVTKVFTRK